MVKTEFEEIAIGDSIWIPLSITKSGNDISYGVISNWSDYPELPTFSIVDSAHYNIDCLVFGTIKKKEKDRGLFSVHVLVDGNVCGYEELGGKYYSPIKNGNLFEHHLMSFWFFVHK
ncbi:hypothetical protein [Ekhidna sp.]|uniref:hypothetical protein n=1 Tax=Ekhidna sp. TaxID=2608089 RepID=UPI003B599AA2